MPITARECAVAMIAVLMIPSLAYGEVNAAKAAEKAKKEQAKAAAKVKKEEEEAAATAADAKNFEAFIDSLQSDANAPLRVSADEAKAAAKLRWFPDRKLERAQAINGNSPMRFLGDFALAIPTSSSDGVASQAAASTTILEGFLPWPGRHDVKELDGKNSFKYDRTLVGIKASSTFNLETGGSDEEADQRLARSITLTDGGVVNLQIERYILGALLPAPATFAVQAMGGGTLEQVRTEATNSDLTYAGTGYASLRLVGTLPVLQGASDALDARAIWFGLESYVRWLPSSIHQALESKATVLGLAGHVALPISDSMSLQLSYRGGRGIELSDGQKFTISLKLNNNGNEDKKGSESLRRLL